MKLSTLNSQLITAFCAAFAATAANAAPNVTLVRDGAPVAKIYRSADDPASAEWGEITRKCSMRLWLNPWS